MVFSTPQTNHTETMTMMGLRSIEVNLLEKFMMVRIKADFLPSAQKASNLKRPHTRPKTKLRFNRRRGLNSEKSEKPQEGYSYDFSQS
jgi:hypothetical protein